MNRFEKIMALGDFKILNLGEIIRYNNRAKIKHENVAEHSFYVASTVLKICKMFSLPDSIKYEALELAIVHDIPELLVGDMPYDTKVNNKQLADLLAQAELEELEKHLPEFLDSYKSFIEQEKEESLAYLVVKLADTVSVLQYSNLERELGNQTKDMVQINEDSKVRVANIIEKIESKLNEYGIGGTKHE